MDPEFGVEVAWDVPLLDGYPWVQLKSVSPRSTSEAIRLKYLHEGIQ